MSLRYELERELYKFLFWSFRISCLLVDVVNHIEFDYLVNPPIFNPTHLTRVFGQITLD